MSLRFVAKSVIQLISCDICFSIRSSDAAHLESWRNSRMFSKNKMDLEFEKKTRKKLSSISTFLHLSLCFFLKEKKLQPKKIFPPLTPLPPSPPPFRWFYFPPALVLQVAVPWELPVGPLEGRHCPASHPPQGCQSFAPWTHRLRNLVTKPPS